MPETTKKKTTNGKMFWYLVVATIPAALVGLLLDDIIENVIRNKIWLIALSLAVMGVLIYVGDKWASKHYKKETKFENITLKQAIIIGISQAFAVIPGFSRSGTTILAGRLQGISKEAIYAEINKKLYKNTANEKILEKPTVTITQKPEEKIDEATLKREKMLIYLLINYTEESFERIRQAVDLECIKSERNKNIIMTLISKISENANIENVVEWFNDEDTVNYLSGILLTDFEIIDENKAIEDIEKIYLKERKVKRRNQIIKLLEDKTNLTNDEAAKLEKELNSIIIDLARMK